MWDLIVSVPDHCLSFYFLTQGRNHFKLHVFDAIGLVIFPFYSGVASVGISCLVPLIVGLRVSWHVS